MEVRFADAKLAQIETDSAVRIKLPAPVIVSARRKLQFIRGAADERDLRAWKSLHFEKLSGDREGQYSIRLNDKWRLVFELETDATPHKVVVIEIDDYH